MRWGVSHDGDLGRKGSQEKGTEGGRRNREKAEQAEPSAPGWLLPDPGENPGAQVPPWVWFHLAARRRPFMSLCQSVIYLWLPLLSAPQGEERGCSLTLRSTPGERADGIH